MQPLEWLMALRKAIFKPDPQIKADSPRFLKKSHESDPQIKAFPTEMFQVQG